MSYSAEVLADAPVLYYRQGDSSGSTMADSSGSSRDASYVGSPTLGAAGALVADADTAVTYNGTSQNGIVASGGAADVALKAMSGPFTLEAWVKVSSLTSNRGVLDRYGNGGSTVSVFLWYIISGKPTLIVRNASNADVSLTANTTLTSGVWAHIVATYDGTNMRVYLNGALDCTPKAATFSSHNRTPLLNIAKFVSSSFFFAGTLDEVAIYDTALSGARISAHYTAGSTASVSGSGSLSLSGSGAASAPVTGTGSLSLSASGAAAAPATGSGSLSLSGSGTANAAATGSASLSLSGSGTAAADVTGSGSLELTGAGDTVPPTAASGTGSLSLSATGDAAADATGSGSLELSGTGTAAGATAATGTGSLDLSAAGAASLAASGTGSLTFDAIGAALALSVTDTTNSLNGRRRHGIATATVDRPAAALPPGRDFRPRYDKAIAHPVPTMVEGRPR